VNVIDRHAITRGAAIGLLLYVPISAIPALLFGSINEFDHSSWAPVVALAIFLVYGIAGFVAARIAVDAPYSNGIVAAIATFILWIPILILIRLVRESGEGLLSGLTPARILGQVVFAAALGAIGGVIASRRTPVDSEPVDG